MPQAPILSELYFLQDKIPRLIFLAFESDDFSLASPAGQQLMRGCFECLPDTKICEDGHQFIRDLVRHQRSGFRNATSRMEALIQSRVFSSRTAQHS